MQCRRAIWTMMVLALSVIGCSGNSSEKDRAGDNIPGPDVAVYEFLEAVRTGDDTKSASMLTDLARERTSQMNLTVAPPGSDTASFKVGEVEMVADELARVACTWTDGDEDGKPKSNEIIWILRREPQGWRIAGMATKIFDDELPLLLDFEDPEDMIRKQQLAEDEIARRERVAAGVVADGPGAGAGPTVGQATKPFEPDGTQRK
jgi:hypothetical protein